MKFKEKISIGTFGGTKFKIRLIDPDDNREAILTHYLHGSEEEREPLKEEAIGYTKELLQYKYPDKEITDKIAEDALQYGLFDLTDIPFMPDPEIEVYRFVCGNWRFQTGITELRRKVCFFQ